MACGGGLLVKVELAVAGRDDRGADAARHGNADDDILQLKARVLQIIVDVHITAAVAIHRGPAVHCGSRQPEAEEEVEEAVMPDPTYSTGDDIEEDNAEEDVW